MNNIKIGLVIATYESAENLERALEPWLAIKNDYKVILSAFHAVFEEYIDLGKPILSSDGTVGILNKLKSENKLDYLNISEIPLSEAAARTLALEPLLKEKVDYVWILDAQDEIYTTDQIKFIINYIQKKTDECVFKINFRNYVFSEKEYLVDNFVPPRIWKVNCPPFFLEKFNFDNDCLYKFGDKIVSDKCLRTKIIPNDPVRHNSWVGSKERLSGKCFYQEKHFAHGSGCSYKFNDSENKLEFNLEYFAKTKQTLPKVIKEY